MPIRKTPRFVEEVRLKDGRLRYRSKIPTGRRGKAKWTRLVDDPKLALKLRERTLELANGALAKSWPLKEVGALVEAEIRTDRSAGHLSWFRCHRKTVLGWFGETTGLHAITPAMIQEFKAARLDQVSSTTVLHHLRALSLILTYALRHGMIERNPLVAVRKPTARQQEADFFTRAEIAEILETIRGSDHPDAGADADLIEFLFLTGLRRSELGRIQIGDVRLPQARIWVQGKRRDEEVQLSRDAVQIARRMIGDRTEGPLYAAGLSGFAACFRRWKAKLEEPRLHAHALRHSFVTALVEAGHPVDVVKELARHRAVATTLKYMHRQIDHQGILDSLSLTRPAAPLRRVGS